tara:strand:- start:96 stop:536 length:441 start_codon:yes stop_codon:yes gene_type:complete
MAAALISTAVVTSYLGNVLVGKMTSHAGSSIYNYLFKKNTSRIQMPIDEYIRQIDIKEKIIISEAFIDSISIQDFKFKQIITSMQDILIETKALLKVIQDKKAKHRNRYFNRYRSVSLDKEHNKLITYDAILSRRLDYLVKLISIQ